MKSKLFNKLVIIIIFLVLISFAFNAYLRHTTSKMNIIYTADIQGFIRPLEDTDKYGQKVSRGGSAYLATYVKKARAFAEKKKEGLILLDTGDIFQGAPEGNFFRGQSMIEIMNALGYDAMTVGDRDFAFGEQNLRNLAKKAQFPFLGANIIEKETGRMPDYIKPYVIKEITGIKVGIVGLTAPSMEHYTLPQNIKGLRFLPSLEVARKYISQLKMQGVKFIVFLNHIGLEQDLELAKKLDDGIDVIIGSNDKAGFRVNKGIINDTIITPHWEKGVEVNSIKFVFDKESSKIIKHELKGTYLDITKFKPDPDMQRIVDKYVKLVEVTKNEIIGYAEETLTRAIDRESSLGNWVADVLREKTQSEIALVSGLQADLKKGDIKIGDVYNILPIIGGLKALGFNTAVLELTGEKIKNILERSLGWALKNSKYGILQVSGLKIIYNPKAPIGNRILEIRVHGGRLSLDKVYKVVINGYLASGGDGYYDIITAKKRYETGLMDFDVVAEYVKEHSPITAAPLGGRIVRLQK